MRQVNAAIEAAIAMHFEGDATLYAAFAASCMQQFAADAATGQAACKSGDLAALRRLCHDLKSVLVVLGYSALSEQAAQVEQHASAGDSAATSSGWQALRAALLRLGSA